VYNVDVYHYNALSNGEKKIYTNNDEIKEYGNRGILDPNSVTYYSLFINGVLQPKVNYEIKEGFLILKTDDAPLEGSPIILTFITISIKESIYSKLNSLTAEGMLPTGHTSIGPVFDLDVCIDNEANNSNLRLEKSIISGPNPVYTGQVSQWDFTLTVTNTSNKSINNIVVTDDILLDLILSLNSLYYSQGNVALEDNTITWSIDILNPGQSATAIFRVKGLFSAPGTRSINRSFAAGTDTTGQISTDVIYTEPIKVHRGIFITNTILSGPMTVNSGKLHNWRVEIKISNISNDRITDILVMDNLFIETIHNIKVVNISKGNAKLYKNKALWNIEELKSQEVAILILDIEGSFYSEGFKNLSATIGFGSTSSGVIFSNMSKDFQIAVCPTLKEIEKEIVLEKSIISEPLAGFLNTFKKWTFSIKATNTTNDSLKNIIITDYMLFDRLDYIQNLSVPSGNVSIYNDTIIWNIDELKPKESIEATFEAVGLFSTTGFRAINRAIATIGSCTLSNIDSGKLVAIFDPIHDLNKTCILANKVYSQYQQRNCIFNMAVYVGEDDFKKITFKPGFIADGTLKIRSIKNHPHFEKVTFQLKIPFQIVTTKNNIIDGYLPNILVDKIMFMPKARDEFSYDINVETYSKLLCPPIKQDNQLNFPVGVFIKVGAIGKVQLFIPTYEFQSNYIALERIEKNSIYNIDILKDILNRYLSHNDKPAKDIQKNKCPVFGRLKLEKHIVSGPLNVSSSTDNTWIVEIKVTNEGNGPISNTVAVDTLLLNKLINFSIISISKGNIYPQKNKIIWNIGRLNSSETAVLLIEITGSFHNNSNYILRGESYQYNAVSNGSKIYTNGDKIPDYGNYGIPNPDEISFLNLFVNGILQPKPNYSVEEGSLTLLTDDVPLEGVPIILEYFKIRNKNGQLLKADVYQYNTVAKGKSIYTNDDELTTYGNQGILNPEKVSYINLFINGVIQPKTNYLVSEGILELTLEPLPIEGAPIILQFITLL